MRSVRVVVSSALLVSASAAPAFPYALLALPALAVAAEPAVERAQEQVQSGDFEAAVVTLERELDSAELSDDSLVEIYRLLGLAKLYLGDEDGARAAYERLLQARPDFTLPRSTPPKVQQLYARILQDIKKRRVRPVTLSVEALPDTAAETAVEASARIEELPLGARGKLFFRRGGTQSYSSVDFTRVRGGEPEAFRAALPAYALPRDERSYEVEYYVEVVDAAQRRLAGRGDAFAPLRFRVVSPSAPVAAAKPEGAWYQNPWVWGVGGAVAAGAVVGIVLVATSRPTGEVTITITVPGTP